MLQEEQERLSGIKEPPSQSDSDSSSSSKKYVSEHWINLFVCFAAMLDSQNILCFFWINFNVNHVVLFYLPVVKKPKERNLNGSSLVQMSTFLMRESKFHCKCFAVILLTSNIMTLAGPREAWGEKILLWGWGGWHWYSRGTPI